MFLTRKRASTAGAVEAGSATPGAVDLQLRLEAASLRCLWLLSRALGPERASDAGAWVMRHLCGRGSRVMRRMRRNLEIALGSGNDEAVDALTRDAVVNLARTVVEYPHLRQMVGAELERSVEFVADVPDAQLSPDRKPAIFIGMHQANWEVVPSIATRLGKPLTIVVSPLTNPYVHRLVSAARPDAWSVQVERDNAIRGLIRSLAKGTSIGMLADQRFEGGGLVPFFGHGAMTALGPARLALRAGCDLVPTRIERIERQGPLCFRITTYAAIRPDDGIDGDHEKALDMMRRVNHHFESWIRAKPGEWMCVKRRWPRSVYRRTSSPQPTQGDDVAAVETV